MGVINSDLKECTRQSDFPSKKQIIKQQQKYHDTYLSERKFVHALSQNKYYWIQKLRELVTEWLKTLGTFK